MLGLIVDIPGLRTRNQLNTRRHWRTDNRERAHVKDAVGYALLGNAHLLARMGKPSAEQPWDVRLVRQGPREMDDDGVVSALKSVRDAFAKFVAIDDKHRQIIRYTYEQERSKTFGVRIEVTPRQGARCA